jgi:hypothetical protein
LPTAGRERGQQALNEQEIDCNVTDYLTARIAVAHPVTR